MRLFPCLRLLCVFLTLVGCAAPRPATLQVTDRDKNVYKDVGAIEKTTEVKYPVSILIKENNVDRNYASAIHAIDSTLTSVLSDLAFFTIVERSNLDLLAKENLIESISKDKAIKMDVGASAYLITAKINAVDIVDKSYDYVDLNGRTVRKQRYAGSVNVDFRFYEKATNRTILTKNIRRDVPNMDSQSEAPVKVASAAQECAKAFAMELGSRYAPPSRVVETRGGGRLAKIAMGSNYGAVKGVKVEFFEYTDNSDIIAGAKREASPVGYGVVTESDLTTAWVDVSDYESSTVMRGHYVKISSDQSKGFKDLIKEIAIK